MVPISLGASTFSSRVIRTSMPINGRPAHDVLHSVRRDRNRPSMVCLRNRLPGHRVDDRRVFCAPKVTVKVASAIPYAGFVALGRSPNRAATP